MAIAAERLDRIVHGGAVFFASGSEFVKPPAPPLPAPIQTVTLAGLIDYAGKLAAADRADLKAAHVADPYTVHLLGATRETWEDRPIYARATFPERARCLPIGDYHDQAGLIIALQTHFEDGESGIARLAPTCSRTQPRR